MATPERSKNNRIETSLRRLEDSPIFDFLNSLSPIKPIKPLPFTQTTNSITFASLQSVFTSPHTSSFKERRFLQRAQVSDPLRPELSNTVNENKDIVDSDTKPDDYHKENIDPTPPNNHQVSKEHADIIAELMRSPDHIPEVGNIDQSKVNTSFDWEDLIHMPSNSSVDPSMRFYKSIEHIIQNRQPCGDIFSGNSSAQPEEESKMREINESLGTNGESSIQNQCESTEYQYISGLYSGMGRRCLVFNNSTSGSCMQQSGSSSVFPGIGMQLNALAPTTEDYNIVYNRSSLYRTSLINTGPLPSFHRPQTCFNQEMSSYILTNISSKRKADNIENDATQVEDSCWQSGYKENEEINPSSSNKKRVMTEQAAEGEGSCKRCTCKKSKCLKLYCECFAAGVYCTGPCACINCFNKPDHGDIVSATRKQIKSRNPLAFAPKVIMGSDSLSEIEQDDLRTTPASARHKRGCNCKKSGCLKKYCECYQSGVGCSITCRCEGCKNKFGTKDGSGAYEHEGETNATNRVELNTAFQKAAIPDNLQQTVESALTTTTSGIGSFPARLALGKSRFIPQLPKFSHLMEDKMPEFLLEGSSNGGNRLASSPSGKRVSPPKSSLERSPSYRSSRKFLSYPSLPQNRE